eukprot:6005684-Pyramimonas_sp.AAC.1
MRINPFQSVAERSQGVPERFEEAAAPDTSSRVAGSQRFSIYPHSILSLIHPHPIRSRKPEEIEQ